MRGHSSIQGSTDVATLYDLLPGYLPQPTVDRVHETLDSYVAHQGLATGYWSHFREFAVSLLKAWYGDAAGPANDYHFDWLPRIDGDHSQLPTFNRMSRGELKGYFLFGQNPGGGGINAGLHRAGLRNLEWLVVLDWFETESAVFWKSDPNGPPPSDIKTEVFLIPAAANPENDGTLTNTQRLLQWHSKAIDPPEDCRSDSWFVYNLGKRLRQLYAGSTDPKDQPLLSLTWDYDYDSPARLPDGSMSRIEGDVDAEKILMEMNGCKLDETDPRTGRPRLLTGFSELKGDGTTACGVWIYSGVTPEPGRNRARERRRQIIRFIRNGDLPGRTTAACFSTAPRPIPMAGLGRSGKSSSGGMPKSASGWDSTGRTSSRTSPPTIALRPVRPAWLRSPATSRSS